MKLKVVKPKPKYYKISYAMLSYHLQKDEPQQEIEEKVKVEQPKAVTKFATKYDKLVDMAITKGLVEEDERELKTLEVQSLSDEEYEKYSQEVEQAVSMKVASITDKEPEYDENMTEAERMLAKIRATGSAPIMTNFPTESDDGLFDDESGSRSLADIKQDRIMAQAMGSMEIKSDTVLETQLFEKAMDDLAQKLHSKKTASVKSPMSGLKGLTKPIVVPQSTQFGGGSNTLANKLANLNWSSGSR